MGNLANNMGVQFSPAIGIRRFVHLRNNILQKSGSASQYLFELADLGQRTILVNQSSFQRLFCTLHFHHTEYRPLIALTALLSRPSL